VSSFDELCRSARVTPAERKELAWHLAQHRARKTYDALVVDRELSAMEGRA
jgi:hypothetical protein